MLYSESTLVLPVLFCRSDTEDCGSSIGSSIADSEIGDIEAVQDCEAIDEHSALLTPPPVQPSSLFSTPLCSHFVLLSVLSIGR
jgi:hypothetical protein